MPAVPSVGDAEPDDEITDPNGPVPMSDVPPETYVFDSTGIQAVDDVLGGGLPVAGVIAIFAVGGTGKSTLVQQMVAGTGKRALYATGEEQVTKVAANARRVGAATKDVMVIREANVDVIIEHVKRTRAKIVAIDSSHTLVAVDSKGEPGTASQIKTCATRIAKFAKDEGVTVIIITHVTSDGEMAGPQTLHHAVDVVLEFKTGVGHDGDERILRCDNKNRFAPSNIVRRLLMTDKGFVGYPEPKPGAAGSENLNPGDDEDPGNDPDPEFH